MFIARHLLALLLLTATAWAVGRMVLRRLGAEDGKDGKDAKDDGLEGFAVATAAGLALLGHLGFLLGLCGLLTREAIVSVIAVLAVLAVLAVVAGIQLVGLPALRPRVALTVAALALAALAPFFLLALYPPTGFDETLYHLPFARAFARTGGVPFLPALRVPVFPQWSEVLFTGLLLLAGDVATHLVELLAALLTAALLVAWGRRAFSPAVGWLAAGIWLGNPIVAYLAGTAYVEPGLALFATAALYAFERWRFAPPAPGRGGGGGWLALAAFFAASAAAIKYLGLFFVGAVFVLAVLAPGRRRRDIAVAGLVALAVLAPWYGRIVYYTGNPIFPFFGSLFGHWFGLHPSPWDPPWDVASRTLAERLSAFLRLPWAVVFDRSGAGLQPPHSPVYLLGLPFVIAAAWRDGRVRRLAGVALGYSLLFLVLPPDARYLVAALPALSLAVAAAVGRWTRPRLAAALAVVCFLPGWLYAGYRLTLLGPVPATAAARDRYLAEQLPVWPAVRFLNRTRGSAYTVYAFYAENMAYLAEGTLLGDWNGPGRFARVRPLVGQPGALHQTLRDLGADHLLIVDGRGVALPVEDPAFRRLFRRVYSDGTSEVYALAPP